MLCSSRGLRHDTMFDSWRLPGFQWTLGTKDLQLIHFLDVKWRICKNKFLISLLILKFNILWYANESACEYVQTRQATFQQVWLLWMHLNLIAARPKSSSLFPWQMGCAKVDWATEEWRWTLLKLDKHCNNIQWPVKLSTTKKCLSPIILWYCSDYIGRLIVVPSCPIFKVSQLQI